MTEPQQDSPENTGPKTDTEFHDLQERCNNLGISYPPDLVEWLAKQPKRIRMGY